ncbi:MAG: glycosyltransferase family 4 protein [Acidimicrobiia bacterium]|nr:glycosyltransferase family 4 protein [Acidimicrobiia bacterium]
MTVRRHLLVTNDFPPKIGGIQNYLWELWRRLPAGTASVYTTPYPGADEFDADQPFAVTRSPEPVLIPHPWLPRRIDRLARNTGSDLVILDPAIPLGAVGPNLTHPTAVVLHGAEVTIPGRIPALRWAMARTLRACSLVIAAGGYPLAEAQRCAGRDLPSVVVPPGVDTERFRPLIPERRSRVRSQYGVADDDLLIVTVNRLVPRKGMDRLIRAVALVNNRRPPGGELGKVLAGGRVRAVIAGTGREEGRLRRLTNQLRAPVQLVGRLEDGGVAELYGAADLMAMPCNSRWWGLEQEGFGIAFLEAAAAGIPQIAGRSGGAHEAVQAGVTGLVLDDPDSINDLAAAIEFFFANPEERKRMGRLARDRAQRDFGYEGLAKRLARAIDACEARSTRSPGRS